MASVEAYQPRGHLSRSPSAPTKRLKEGGTTEGDAVTYWANDTFIELAYLYFIEDACHEVFDYVMGLPGF